MKMFNWKRTSFSMSSEVIHVLNKVPRTELPNKSKLVESLVREWLIERGYKITGSLADTKN